MCKGHPNKLAWLRIWALMKESRKHDFICFKSISWWGTTGMKIGNFRVLFQKASFQCKAKETSLYIDMKREYNIVEWKMEFAQWCILWFCSSSFFFFPKALKIAIQSKVCNWHFWLLHGWDLFIWNLIECQPHGKSSNSGQARWQRY